jgi:hypothetical protein
LDADYPEYGVLIPCRNTELISYRDGKSRRILTSSLREYVESRVAAEAKMPRANWTEKATKVRAEQKAIVSPGPAVSTPAKGSRGPRKTTSDIAGGADE